MQLRIKGLLKALGVHKTVTDNIMVVHGQILGK